MHSVTQNLRTPLALLAVLLLVWPATAAAQTVIYVDSSASAPGDGTSWSSAYPALQDAFDEANANPSTDYEIWIAGGTYFPDEDNIGADHTADDQDESFTLERDGVEIYGGFDGGETQRSDRDVEGNAPAILSGDIQQDDDPFEPNVDSDGDPSTPTQTDHINGSNSNHVLILDGGKGIGADVDANVTGATVLDGVTVASGQVASNFGAGLYCDGSETGNACSPEITNVTFAGNFSDLDGGAIYNDGADGGVSNPVITDATFEGNYADEGGAIYNSGNSGESSPEITGTTFTDNEAGSDGGAIYNDGGGSLSGGLSSPTITDATFTSNSAEENGGAMYNVAAEDGGQSSPQISSTTFVENTAEIEGGAIYSNGSTNAESSPVITDGTFESNSAEDGGAMSSNGVSNPQINGTAFTENTATIDGGAIYGVHVDSDVEITDATFTNNSAGSGGAIESGANSLFITNTTFENNSATGSSAIGGAIYNDGSTDEENTQITGSTFTGNSADEGGAIHNEGTPSIENTDFNENNASENGGAIHNLGTSNSPASPPISDATFIGNNAEEGGAIYNNGSGGASSPTITNGLFLDNNASEGGAIYNEADDEGTSSPVITNAVFSGNSGGRGGAIYNLAWDDSQSSPVLSNVTFANNSAGGEGGAIHNRTFGNGIVTPQITNAIFWGNSAENGGNEIYNSGSMGSTVAPTLRYTLIEGGCEGISENNGSSTDCGDGSTILDTDPQFADADGPDDTPGTTDDDVRLQGVGSGGGPSPAIDAGDNSALPDSMTQDLAGLERRQDVPEVTDTGSGSAPIVDLGAYESNGAPLPVELAGFDATVDENEVRLKWQTASETNNAEFQVQRRVASTPGVRRAGEEANGREDTWTTVGTVEGSGTTSQAQSYRFTDEDLPYAADALTYRLRQVDTDGSAHLSETITVERGVTELELLGTYPNPAQQRATVRYALPEKQKASIRLYDVLGRQVRTVVSGTQEGRHERTLDVGALPSGVYFLRLRAGGETRTERLTVVK